MDFPLQLKATYMVNDINLKINFWEAVVRFDNIIEISVLNQDKMMFFLAEMFPRDIAWMVINYIPDIKLILSDAKAYYTLDITHQAILDVNVCNELIHIINKNKLIFANDILIYKKKRWKKLNTHGLSLKKCTEDDNGNSFWEDENFLYFGYLKRSGVLSFVEKLETKDIYNCIIKPYSPVAFVKKERFFWVRGHKVHVQKQIFDVTLYKKFILILYRNHTLTLYKFQKKN